MKNWLAKTLLGLTIATMSLIAPAARAGNTPEGPVDPAGRVPDEIKNVGVDEHLGRSIRLDAMFINEKGESRPLRDYLHPDRPLVLQMGYFQCPMLCSLVSRGLVDSSKQVGLVVGKDYDMLFVSIDSSETPSLAALKKQNTVQYYGKPEEAAGFHFLVGKDSAINALADTTGFRFEPMPDTQQFAHAAVIMVITPEGKISRYLYGVKFEPKTLRLSLVEASANKIGTTMDQLLLICLHYDAATGKYAWVAMGLMRMAGLATILVLGGTMFWMFRREFRAGTIGRPNNGAGPTTTKNDSQL